MPADPGGAVARSLRRAAGLPDPDAPADGRLLLRFRRAGDEDAFAELVRRHGPMVLGVCRRVAGNHTDADDAFQAAFLVLVRRAAELTGRATVGDFLYGVAVRTALKARATAVKRRLKEARAAKPEAAPPPADESDRAAALDRELARLPEKYRAALVLCELEGRPRKDVAALLGIPQGTLSSRLAAGRKLLAGRLRRCGLALPAGGLAAPVAGVVPSKLLEATVRAATGAADGGVSELATEVTRAMLLTKLRAGLLVVPTVLVLGAALAAAGRPAVAGPDGPAAKPAPAVAKPPEPAWRKDFDRAYALKDGEVLKRVPPPYPAARAEYLKAELLGGIPVGPGDRLDHWHALFRWADGRLYGEASVCGRPGKPAAVALQELLTRLVPDLLPNEIEGDEELLRAVGVDGDFVVRHGADPAKVAARLGEILRTELKLPVKVGVREAEREVAVAVGPLKVEPLAGRPKDRVEVYGAEPADPKRGRAVRTGTVAEFLRDLSRFTGMRVVAGAGLDPKARLSWRENVRLPAPDADGPTRERMWAEDHDPAAVLRNVGDQTGLRFPAEKRKVRVLFAEYVEQ